MLWTYVYVPLPIYGTLWILLIGYITRFLPYGLRTMTSTIVQLHDDLQQASMVCGAGFLTTFRRILLPLLRPGFIAGWIILATIFLREFSTSVFLYSPGSEPLGPLLYHFYVDGNLGPMCALALIVSVICACSHHDRPENRQGRRRHRGILDKALSTAAGANLDTRGK